MRKIGLVLILIYQGFTFGQTDSTHVQFLRNNKYSISYLGYSEFDKKTSIFYQRILCDIEKNLNEDDSLIVWVDLDQNIIFNCINSAKFENDYLNSEIVTFREYNIFLKNLFELTKRQSNIKILGSQFFPNITQFEFINTIYPELINNNVLSNIKLIQNPNSEILSKNTAYDELINAFIAVENSKINFWDKYYISTLIGRVIFNPEYFSSSWMGYILEETDRMLFFISNQYNQEHCIWKTKFGITTLNFYLNSPTIRIKHKNSFKIIKNEYFSSTKPEGLFKPDKNLKYGIFNIARKKIEPIFLNEMDFIFNLQNEEKFECL